MRYQLTDSDRRKAVIVLASKAPRDREVAHERQRRTLARKRHKR